MNCETDTETRETRDSNVEDRYQLPHQTGSDTRETRAGRAGGPELHMGAPQTPCSYSTGHLALL